MGQKWKQWQILFSWAPKSLGTVTAAMKDPYSQSYDFPSSHVWMWELDYKEGWAPKNWCFWIVVFWRRLLRVPWTARRSNQLILKEINFEYSFEGCWSWNSNTLATWCKEPTLWKRPWCWERFRTRGEGGAEDEMIRKHPWLNGHEFEQSREDSEG